jgi:GT2 family glycosyltransferase
MVEPRVSIIVPSRDGHRNGLVPRLLATIEQQSYRDREVIVVRGVEPQGRAINEGVGQSRGEYLVIVDDDSRLADDCVIGSLVACLDSDPRIGMAGASILLDPEATLFQRRAARQFPRLCTPEVDRIMDSDLACHGCCAISRRVFDEIGGEREDILRGLDPDLRVRLRAAGYRVVLVPGARIYHPLPRGWRETVRTFFRNGFGSAYAQKFEPGSVYETHEALDSARFRPRRPWIYRALRFPVRLGTAIVRGNLIRFVAYSAYAFGYLYGLVRARRIAPKPARAGGPGCGQGNDSRAA